MSNRARRLSGVLALTIVVLLLGACGSTTAYQGPDRYPGMYTINFNRAGVPTTGRDHGVVLGGTDDAFIAELGHPVNEFGFEMDPALPARILAFAHYGNTFIDGVVTVRDTTDPEREHRIMLILLSSAPNEPWTQDEANTYSTAYTPVDAQPAGTAQVANTRGLAGSDNVYVSPTLAQEFPASAFTDEDGNLVTPGTFNIQYIYPSASQSSQILSCQLALGTRQTFNT